MRRHDHLSVVPDVPDREEYRPLSDAEKAAYWGEVVGVCDRGLRRAVRERNANAVPLNVDAIHDAIGDYDVA
jgi:hypothetical protein